MATKYDRTRLVGVYTYTPQGRRFQGAPDLCFVITYKKPDGKKVWEKVGFKSEGYTAPMAAKVRAERVRAMRHGEEVKTAREIARERQSADRTLSEIGEAYFDSDRGRALKNPKPDRSRWDRWLVPSLGSKRISSLTELDVQRIKRDMEGKAPQTIRNTLELLRRVCRWGARHGLCPPLGFTVELPRCDNERTEYLTNEQAQRLLKVLEEWPRREIARMVEVAMLTGMRRGELFKLQDRDIDRQHHLITLRSPKGKRTTTIPLSQPVDDLLRMQAAWRDTLHPGSPYLFPGRGGRRRVDCSAVDRIKAAARLPKGFRPFHGLRHNFAVALANSGKADLGLISELLTHKDTQTTRRYAKFLPETKRQASELAASLILGTASGGEAEESEQAPEEAAAAGEDRARPVDEERSNVLPLRKGEGA